METQANALKEPWLPVVLLAFVVSVYPLEATSSATLMVTRHNNGDIFTHMTDSNTKCIPDTCVGISSGTATAISNQDMCTCRCHPHLPAFREDLRICVDDIHECVIAPFVGGSTSQQIPFVYLPLKGQVIYPGKEISLNGIQTPVCAVSGAKYMTDDGWIDLRNPVDSDVPFRLFKDNGRAFLQWSGYGELRAKLSGRLVMVHLMCREVAESESTEFPRIQMLFSPCVAFRVVGSPTKQLVSNVSEVAFVIDQNVAKETTNTDTLSVTEYVVIGICSILLGLIYVASVFLYLHLKKKKANSRDIRRDSRSVRDIEEGIVKSNPLLSMPTHFLPGDAGYSDTNSSDNETAPDIIKHHEDRKKQTSALVHAQKLYNFNSRLSSFSSFDNYHQDSNTNERLPEENVSIVETLEGREERPENIKSLTGATRKKLYFNPAYFDTQLLLEPPPAALEFLSKIREVISIAKQKLASKRFTPSLLNIPEEENQYPIDTLYGLNPSVSRRSSIISLKRENSRRKTCTGCPGCEPQDFKSITGKLPEFPALVACHNCTLSSNESKQRIRKWLEDVPIIKVSNDLTQNPAKVNQCPKRVRSPTRTLPTPSETKSPLSVILRKPLELPPPPPINLKSEEENFYYTVPLQDCIMSLPPPDMIQEAMELDRTEEKVATLTKEQMNAVIYEFTKHKNLLDNKGPNGEYETDSLERTPRKGYSTPSEYADVSSSQPSPSLSAVLPDQEEMTMRNAIFNKKTGNMTISKINMDALQEDDHHEYELIVMKKGSMANNSEPYNLAHLIQKNKEYSLVSEVYVNNGYNYGSAPSTPSNSRYSTLDMKQLKVKYEGTLEKPGKLLIEVEDCLDNYIPVHDSDEFEQDTLDRKSNRNSKRTAQPSNYEDSLERPSQILLTTTGSFRNSTETNSCQEALDSGNFNRVFGSLREIYEAKARSSFSNKVVPEEGGYTFISDDEKGRMLTLEERHSKRQRSKETVVQPDVIPPPPHDASPIYEHLNSSRPVSISLENGYGSNTLTPKNGHCRSVSNEFRSTVTTNHSPSTTGTPDSRTDEYKLCLLQKSKKSGSITNLIQTEDFILKKGCNDQFIFHSVVSTHPKVKDKLSWQNTLRPEDSGYLSSDSNESRFNKVKLTVLEPIGVGSETDESLGDGHSESGAESVETHSVFFGRFHRNAGAGLSSYGSMDSGVIGGEEGVSSSDSETVSYTTVIPVTSDHF